MTRLCGARSRDGRGSAFAENQASLTVDCCDKKNQERQVSHGKQPTH